MTGNPKKFFATELLRQSLNNPFSYILRETRTPSGQLCCAKCEGPLTESKTADANLDCVFVENTLFTLILDCVKSTENK